MALCVLFFITSVAREVTILLTNQWTEVFLASLSEFGSVCLAPEGYQKVRQYRSVIWKPVPVLVKGNTTKCMLY